MAPLQLKGCMRTPSLCSTTTPSGASERRHCQCLSSPLRPRSPCSGHPLRFLLLARWLRTRRFHVRWFRCRRPASGTGPLPLRLCLRLHFCSRLCAVGTCSRASGRVSRARSTPSLAIATHLSSSLKVSSTVTQSTGASG